MVIKLTLIKKEMKFEPYVKSIDKHKYQWDPAIISASRFYTLANKSDTYEKQLYFSDLTKSYWKTHVEVVFDFPVYVGGMTFHLQEAAFENIPEELKIEIIRATPQEMAVVFRNNPREIVKWRINHPAVSA